MKKIILSFAIAGLIFCGVAWAEDAPVVDVTENSTGGDQSVSSVTSPSDNNMNPFDRSYGLDSDSQPSSNNQANANAQVNENNNTTEMTLEQRVDRLEQQLANIVRMNLPQQIADIQQTMQQLQGQLQVQRHDLQLLSQQQRNFYQDLDHRIAQLKNGTESNTSNATNDNNQLPPTKPILNNVQMKDSNTYRSAFTLLTKKNYDQAKLAFQNYLNDYPKGHFLESAHYWLGEINLLQKNYDKAETQFKTIVTNYPNSAKTLDAKLKLAIIHVNQGKMTLARKEFEAIKKQNPNTTAAQLATIHLQQLDQVAQPPSS